MTMVGTLPGDVGEPGSPENGVLGVTSEWIDPEGDDWFAQIYRELVSGPDAADPAEVDSSYWLG